MSRIKSMMLLAIRPASPQRVAVLLCALLSFSGQPSDLLAAAPDGVTTSPTAEPETPGHETDTIKFTVTSSDSNYLDAYIGTWLLGHAAAIRVIHEFDRGKITRTWTDVRETKHEITKTGQHKVTMLVTVKIKYILP